MSLGDRVIVVTGAARGLGAAIATSAADAGATVVGADLVPTPPDERVVMRELDVTDEGQWDAFADWLGREWGACHGLVNTASKWALRGLSRAASLELGPRGIRVNAVMPGLMATSMTSDVPQLVSDALLGSVPLGRAATTADVAAAVCFLLSDEAAYLSGLEVPVDGGQTAHGGMKVLSDAVRAAASAPAPA
jgi:NAD(P)-dependent dehydrogenase (short-subunit alcohol dehydrogenase family)